MRKYLQAVLQRALTKNFDAAIVRASWLNDLRKTRDTEDAYCKVIAHYEVSVARYTQAQADLAAAHRQLLMRHDSLKEDNTKLEAECATLAITHKATLVELGDTRQELLNLKITNNKALETMAKANEEMSLYKAKIKILTDSQASFLTESSRWREAIGKISEGSNLVIDKLQNLTTAIDGSIRNFLYAADLTPAPHQITAEHVRKVAGLLQPRKASGRAKVRIGRNGDGGYVMVDDFTDTRVAYSLGVGDDVSWDIALAQKGIEVHQFDHTVTKSPVTHSGLHFHQKRISTRSSDKTESLATMIAYAAESLRQVNPVLKIDIEYDEWNILDEVETSLLSIFSQIVCEFHWFGRAVTLDWIQKAERVLTKMNLAFQVVHVHGNNCAPYSLIGGVPLPSVLEVTYCNRVKYDFEDSDEVFPGSLDFPNNADAPDLYLGTFRF